jgi:uncharacterized repeat protein (TIGR03803 family)
VFAVNTNGTGFTNLYSFTALDQNYSTNSDGTHPYSGLLLSDGVLYGTAKGGGAYDVGTVFALNTNGTGFTTLHSFAAGGGNLAGDYTNGDGASANASLILSGNTLYGTAEMGGVFGSGTVFALNTDGSGFTTLYDFTASDPNTDAGANNDGARPATGLVLSGNTLYGTADGGGAYSHGTVFALDTNGASFTNLHSFTGGADGDSLFAGVIISGNILYGTTHNGGNAKNGTIFCLNTNGADFKTLFDFSGSHADGGEPGDGLILSGNTLYGTARFGGGYGPGGDGSVFALKTSGAGFTNLHSFTGGSGGAFPSVYAYQGVILSGDTLYGMTQNGGSAGDGTVFSLSSPLFLVPKIAITISSTPSGGGTTTGAGDYTNGQSVTVTAAPNGCYDFVHWISKSKIVSTDSSYTFTASASAAFIAVFSLKEDAIVVASSPAKGGKTTGSGAYGCDKPVTLRATAAPGYKFIHWAIDGALVSAANPYIFRAAGAESLTAEFTDISVPTVTITAPTLGQKVNASLLEISGAARDPLGVGSVVLNFNGQPVVPISTNNWSNWSAYVILSPGTNKVSVYALNEVGIPSKAVAVTFDNLAAGQAPVALGGLVGAVQIGAEAAFQVSFGPATFEQFSADTNQGSSVATYTYTQTGPDTATFATSALAPPAQNGGGGAYFTFTDPAHAAFTNDDGTTATLTLSPGLTLDVSSLSGWTITSADVSNNSTTTTYGDGTFTSTADTGIVGGYTSMQYGPMASMVVLTNADPSHGGVETNYSMVTFANRSNGVYFSVTYDGAGDPPSYHSGPFAGVYQPNGERYLAPESLTGLSGALTAVLSNGKKISAVLSFGASTGGQFTTDLDADGTVSAYTYARTGPKTALFRSIELSPPDEAETNGVEALNFISGQTANYTNSERRVTLTFSKAANTAPLSLLGRSITSVHQGRPSTTLFEYGTFTGSGDLSGTAGTYTYAPYGPQVALLIQKYTVGNGSGTAPGTTHYGDMWFSSATGGSFREDDGSGNITTGTFSLK